MASSPIDAYRNWVEDELRKRLDQIARNNSRIAGKAAAAGAFNSSRTALLMERETLERFEAAVDEVIGMLKLAQRKMKPMSHQLRTISEERLREFMVQVKADHHIRTVTMPVVRTTGPDRFEAALQISLDRFDHDLHDVEEPRSAPSAIINVTGDMIGNAIQQNSPGASQQAQFNANDAFKALEVFETAVKEAGMTHRQEVAITASLALLKDEVRKSEPDSGAIRTIGKSIRGITESVVATGVGAAIAPYATKLWAALGLG